MTNQKEIRKWDSRGAWVAQSVKPPTSAQVMISRWFRFVSLSPTWGSVLTVGSLLWILCPPLLSSPPPLARAHTHTPSLKNKQTKKKKMRFQMEMKILCKEIGKPTRHPFSSERQSLCWNQFCTDWVNTVFCPQLTGASPRCDLLLWDDVNTRGGWAGLFEDRLGPSLVFRGSAPSHVKHRKTQPIPRSRESVLL